MPEVHERPGKTRSLLPWLPVAAAIAHLAPQVDLNYGAAYYLFDYRHGFVKRGLLGELFRHVGHLSRTDARLIELFILLLTTVATYYVFREPLFRDGAVAPLTAMLLSGPALLPHFFIMFIPTDPLLYTVLVVCVWAYLRYRPAAAWGLSLLLCVVALFVHEGFAVRFYPLVIALLLEMCRRRRLPWAMLVAHVAAMLVFFGLIVHFGKSATDPLVYATEAQARAGYSVDPQLYLLMHQTAMEGRRQSMDFIWNRGTLQGFALSFLLAIPYALAVIVALRRAMRAAAAPLWQMVLTALLFLSPLVLCPITTDWFRWLSDCFICATLFLLYLYGADAGDGPVRTTLRSFAQTTATTFLIGYVCTIGAFAGMWLSASNTIGRGYYDRPVTNYYDRYIPKK